MLTPGKVITSLPLTGIGSNGMRDIVIVTLEARTTTSLRVMAGELTPRRSTMAGNVPAALAPTMVPSFAEMAAEIVETAPLEVKGFVNPEIVKVMGVPAMNIPATKDITITF